MPRLKNYGPGRRVSVWIPEKHLKLWDQLENKSKFVSLCLEEAIGIMTFYNLKKLEPGKYDRVKQPPLEEVLPEFNANYPLDELTKKRKKCHENSPPKPELW